MGKKKKTNESTNLKSIKQAKIKTSEDCRKCINGTGGCSKGENYLNNMIPGKIYNGVTCLKQE